MTLGSGWPVREFRTGRQYTQRSRRADALMRMKAKLAGMMVADRGRLPDAVKERFKDEQK